MHLYFNKLYQEVFINEMVSHMEIYRESMKNNCGPEHMQHGVCICTRREVKAPFSTTSSPTTFLVVAEPQAPHQHAHYHFAITDTSKNIWRSLDWTIFGGTRLVERNKVMVFENRHLVSNMIK